MNRNSQYDELEALERAIRRALEQICGPYHHARTDVHALSLNADLTHIQTQLAYMQQRGVQRFGLELRNTPLANVVHYLHRLGFTAQDGGDHALWVDTTTQRRDEFPLIK